MRNFLAMLVLGAGLTTTVPDPTNGDRTWITDNGERVYEIRKDPVVQDQWQMMDREGNRTGTWRKDPFNEDRWLLREGP
jgi:hypothetical protein